MIKARRKEGPCAPLFFLAAAALLLSVEMTNAQTVDIASLELCTGLETQELKLACFEAIIAAARTPGEQITEPAIEEVPETAPAASNPKVAVATASESEPVMTEAVPELAHSQVATEVSPAIAVTPSTKDFGREQLATAENEGVIKAIVVDVTKAHNKALNFHLANGQIWRQLEPRHFQYPKQGHFEVIISQGVMGEYRLRIDGKGRMVRIRRIK